MNWILFAIIVILQGLDVYSTVQALKIPGNYEANKLMSWIMVKMGVIPALVLTKLTLCILLATAIYFYSSVYLTGVLVTTAVGYSAVVISNFRRA